MTCEHKWFVVGKDVDAFALRVRCDLCGASGRVGGPSREEWSMAYYADKRPYAWGGGRVQVADIVRAMEVVAQTSAAETPEVATFRADVMDNLERENEQADD